MTERGVMQAGWKVEEKDGRIKVSAGLKPRVCGEGNGGQGVARSCCGLLTCWENG